jgi:hypothetical protein
MAVKSAPLRTLPQSAPFSQSFHVLPAPIIGNATAESSRHFDCAVRIVSAAINEINTSFKK